MIDETVRLLQLIDIIGKLDRHHGSGIERRIDRRQVFAERREREAFAVVRDLTDIDRHCVMVVVNT